MYYFPGRKIFFVEIGPFIVKATTNSGHLVDLVERFYPYSLSFDSADRIADIHVELLRIFPTRRWQLKRMVFLSDLENPYSTFPLEHNYPYFEWGLNWCIAMQAHQYLMLHSAVLEKQGKALILPALPGSGKSTLCAALTLRGWRLLSDEFGLYRPETRELTPMPRPMPLKNQSIEVIRQFAQDVPLGPLFRATPKGDVCHVQASEDSFRRQKETARPGWVVFPQFKKDVTTRLYDFAKGRAFLKLAGNSFNYKLQGERGFRAVTDLVRNCGTYYLEFDSLEHATAELDGLCGSA